MIIHRRYTGSLGTKRIHPLTSTTTAVARLPRAADALRNRRFFLHPCPHPRLQSNQSQEGEEDMTEL